MTDLGYAALLIGFVLSIYAIITYVWGARGGFPEILESARNAVLAVAGLVTLAAAGLLYALLTDDYSLKAVHDYTSRDMAPVFKATAFWASQSGSLLLWTLVLALLSAAVLYQHRQRHRELLPYAMATMMAVESLFLFLVSFIANPFQRLPFVPADGQGLNPLLENVGMVIHPPALYLGYVGFTVPFAFAIAALITRRLGDEWLRAVRGWTLLAWFFLGLGNLLGAQWAYTELGWGGYWGWDPVENASLMPWLTGTAFLHSARLQVRRGMFKAWNMGLLIATFVLTIFGTFLTRSGVLQSVHSFGDNVVGSFLLAGIILILVGSLSLLFSRLSLLDSEHDVPSLLSREAAFLLTNLILVLATFVTFWGTMFPLFSELTRGVQTAVEAPWFNQWNGRILLVLIMLMGLCPLIPWRQLTIDNLRRNFVAPLVVSVLVGVGLYAGGVRILYVTFTLAVCAFVVTTVLVDWYRGIRARHQMKRDPYWQVALSLAWANKPRYGGSIVHVGIILLAVGVISSMTYQVGQDATLAKGETMSIQGYSLQFDGLTESQTPSRTVVTANLNLTENGQPAGRITADKIFHRTYENPVTEVGIRSTPWEDLYVILAGWTEDGTATFKVFVNPMAVWIWIGGGIALLGTVLAAWPEAATRRQQSVRPARLEVAGAESR